MMLPSHSTGFETLLLQACDEGRDSALFGGSGRWVARAARPFMVGVTPPSIYLEFPLSGDPFLDVTVLYDDIAPGTRIDSPLAAGTDAMLDCFAGMCDGRGERGGHGGRVERGERGGRGGISCGFELDTKHADVPSAAVHFQPRNCIELIAPFCEALGEAERGALYVDMARRMPDGWPLSFFGMFRGRPGSPLRVCGYLSAGEVRACTDDLGRLPAVFDEIGFEAYDADMLQQVRALMAAAPGALDFQFDVLADGKLGPTFAIDLQFGIEQPSCVRASFEDGSGARVMGLLEGMGAADGRWRLAPGAAFARALPVELEDGSSGRYAFTLMPQWAKARWTCCALQPAKLYLHAHAGLVSGE